jgi:hypothetical protein
MNALPYRPGMRLNQGMTTTAWLRHEGGNLRISFAGFDLMPGSGAHRFRFKIEGAKDGLTGNTSAVTILSGSVENDSNPSAPWVGQFDTEVVTWKSYPTTSYLSLTLTDDQLVDLDRTRANKPLNLRITLKSTLLDLPPGLYPVVEEQIRYTISHEKWMRLLDRAGLAVGLLIRVAGPILDAGKHPGASEASVRSMAQAVLRLRQARDELADHRWEQAVATCRMVQENIAAFAPRMPTREDLKAKPDPAKDEEERWAAMFYAVMALTHPAHHDDATTIPFTWNHQKAEAVVTATAGLLNVFEPK